MRLKVKPKRIVSLALAGCMAVSMLPASAVTAFAAENTNVPAISTGTEGEEENQSKPTKGDCGATENDKVTYELTQNEDGATYTLTISGAGAMADYSGIANDDDVGKANDLRPWATYRDQITKVVIEEGVTAIGDSAFRGLTALTSANIPASIKDLGDHIFRGDAALETVTWASGFTAPTITDSDSNAGSYTGTYVPTSMFDGCVNLGKGQDLSAWLPDSFTGIGCAAVRGTQFTVNFDQWSNLKYIGAYAFSGMPNLDHFTLTNNVEIGLRHATNGDGSIIDVSNAFQGSGLKKLTVETDELPKMLTRECAELNTVDLGDKIKSISDSTFRNAAIEEIDIPASTEKVENWAFVNCAKLKKLTLHGKTYLETVPFPGCSIEEFVIDDQAEITCNDNPFRGSGDYSAVTTLNKVVILGTLNSTNGNTAALWKNMFAQSSQLKEVEVSAENLQYVNADTFPGMEKLTVKGDNVELTKANVSVTNLKTIDLSGCKNVTYAADFGTGMSNSSVIYVDDADTSLPAEHGGVVMVTNGGAVDVNGSGFESVTKEGCDATWYEDADYTTPTADTAPVAGKTYYAKWDTAVRTLTVKNGTFTYKNGEKDITGTTGEIPYGTEVTVTFDKDAFADSGLKFGHWDIEGLKDPNAYQGKESFTFKMPANNVTLEAMTQDATIEDEGPDILGTAAVITTAAVGGAVLAYTGYQLGSELYLIYLLPTGAEIPTNTAQLAKLVWTDAGKPAPAALLAEDATEEQQAMAWAVETGLIDADQPADASVSRTEVIKTWKKAQSVKKG